MKQKEISECIGLYLGDGLRSMTGSSKYRLSFTNTDKTLLVKVKRFFQAIGATNSKIYLQVGMNDNEKGALVLIKHLMIYPLNVKFRKKRKGKPAIQIRVFDVKLRAKLNKIIENEIKKLTKEKATNILRGLFAAEGRVKLQKKSLNALCIATAEKKNYLLLKKIFKILKIKNYYSHCEFYIHGFKQFKKFKELKIHVLHSEKKKKFENAYLVLLKNLGLTVISPRLTAE